MSHGTHLRRALRAHWRDVALVLLVAAVAAWIALLAKASFSLMAIAGAFVIR